MSLRQTELEFSLVFAKKSKPPELNCAATNTQTELLTLVGFENICLKNLLCLFSYSHNHDGQTKTELLELVGFGKMCKKKRSQINRKRLMITALYTMPLLF